MGWPRLCHVGLRFLSVLTLDKVLGIWSAGYFPWLSPAHSHGCHTLVHGRKDQEMQGLPWQNGTLKVCDVMPSAQKGHSGKTMSYHQAGILRLPKRGRVLMSPEDRPFIFPIVSSGTYFLLFIPVFINQWVMSLASQSKRLPSCGSFQNERLQRFRR